jgi:nondiscriminating aspartyl-tRNA synthetase
LTRTLDGWQRTAYSSDITPAIEQQRVTLLGWVESIRRQGGITFILLRDKDGEVQLTFKKRVDGFDILDGIEGLKVHSSLGVKGIVSSASKAPHGAEIIPDELKVLSVPRRLPPFKVFAKKALPGVDKRFDLRAVDLRRPQAQWLFKVRQVVLRAMRDYFTQHRYVEVNTPKIIASATEGGASLFPLLYYDKEAFLAQSPQLYKEQLVMAFEKIFEIAPAFRAEQSRTPLHLSEFISLDVEEAYIDYLAAMQVLEEMVHCVIRALSVSKEETPVGIALDQKLTHDQKAFKKYTYDEALEIAVRKGLEMDWGDDISPAALEIIAEETPGFYFITDWPLTSKPFYIQPCSTKRELSESFDLLYGATEIASGGSRIHSKELLIKRMRDSKLKPKSFEYHLRIFDYGMPPHAGFGLGLERFLVALTGEKNIRELTFFPRDQRRLTP